MVPPRKGSSAPEAVGEDCYQWLIVAGFERQSARHSGPEGRPDTLRLTVGSMKISRTALIALATAALLSPRAATVFGQTQPAQQAPATKQQPANAKAEIFKPDMTNKERVVAKVNGHGITVKEIELAADDILPQLPDRSEEHTSELQS